ncbi:MAG: hypothetical protein WCM76_13690 [Bacteroidota bacterium]
MKKLTFLLVSLLLVSGVFAQAPQLLSYQAVIRNPSNVLVTNATVGMRVSILQGSPGGSAVFSETQTPTTNQNGLATIQIGNGVAVTGSIGAIDWSAGPYFLKVETDPAGGISYSVTATTELLSVPYALYAETANVPGVPGPTGPAGPLVAGTSGQTLRHDGSNWTANSNIYNDPGTDFVGIGTTTPSHKFTVSHSGSTGIGVTSTASFSVVDIDAFTGDAALRFGHAGVNQWNIRNTPYSDDLEIFELGGGGSRITLQNGTGNLGIGTQTPTTRLETFTSGANNDVLSRTDDANSTASFTANNNAGNYLDLSKMGTTVGASIYGITGADLARISTNTAGLLIDASTDIYFGTNSAEMMRLNSAGYLGIGTTNPSHKLEVSHGGSTGIQSISTSGFSVVDIDAFSGDAALRYYKAGVGKWNVRNNPATDAYQIFQLSGGGERMRIDASTGNVTISQGLAVVGLMSKGGGSFKIDDPIDPANKYLYHSFVESPDMMNIYNGNIVTDASGKAVVQLPAYFEALNMEFRYQLTVIGTFDQAIISKEVSNNQFEITTTHPNVKVSWQVTGIRHDAFAEQNRIPNEIDKEPENKGKYLHPTAFNLPASQGIYYTNPDEGVTTINEKVPLNTGQTVVKKADNKVKTTDASTKNKPVNKVNSNVPSSIDDTKPVGR